MSKIEDIIGLIYITLVFLALGVIAGYSIASNEEPKVVQKVILPNDSFCRNVEISGQPAMQCCCWEVGKEVR